MAQFYTPGRRTATRKNLIVTATDLDAFGQGVARDKGKTLFISGLLPGEEAEVILSEEKRQFARGRVTRLISHSPQRVAPRCPHAGVCGGCQQQHAAIALQQQSKSQALQRLMARETGVEIAPQVIAGEPYGYRRRARFGLQFNAKTQRVVLGFRQAASNDLVALKACPVLAPALEALLLPLGECLSALRARRRLGHLELALADNGPLMVLRHLDPLALSDREALSAFARQRGLSLYLSDGGAPQRLLGEAPYYQIDGIRLDFNPQDFIQVNAAVNAQMVEQALAWLDVRADERVLDLFCGMGNFTLPLARRAQRVVGVEGVPELVATAQNNARNNGLSNVEFFHQNLEEDVTRQAWAAQGFDKILLDPARAGAPGVMQHIVRLAPRRVVYVSCNPTTLARDSKTLLQGGYRLTRLCMLDMFPHTGHLESMALFESAAQ
ncbi:23S rRNA (uracil(1939)-C(5))-methyltransferase RlmD [Edwardsiella piscicida]|nr:23S rRNA (uracil(1939)-C(5))-methyltransferase RlmD [Edwardsiella piscicida]ELM3730295.1 23S rRNA (uracil(1939)-C(5))-methyltransferase RlmD [Edwardsiella piscicida]ELV7537496.1 23S rRNA (uracil(1939)-C(5))-methyltransferase RlmD [Edwardsiella piscicida]